MGVLPLLSQSIKQAEMRKRSITIDGHRTSITLEDAFWEELTALARGRAVSLNALVAEVDHARPPSPTGPGNLSSALRVYVLNAIKGNISRA
jgi:predicted DNA-binding ribbon-helix-helix protein